MSQLKKDFHNVLNGENPRTTPYRISISGDIIGNVAAQYGPDFRERYLKDTIAHFSFWVRWPNVVYKKNEKSTWIEGILINDWKDLDSYPWPDSSDSEWFSDLDKFIKTWGETHPVVVMFPSVFHSADTFRGYDKFFLDVYDEPEKTATMLEKITQTLEVMVDNICMRPIDLLIIGDDISTQSGLMASPAFLDQYVHKYNKRILDVAKKRGKKVFFHTDGVLPDVLTDKIIDMGFDGMHPMQYSCNNMHEWASKYKDRLVTYGWLDNVHICSEGNIRQIEEHVRDIFKTFGNRFFCSSSDIMGNPPAENIIKLPEIIREVCTF
jgi:uroporphyrinogen decarboxylase